MVGYFLEGVNEVGLTVSGRSGGICYVGLPGPGDGVGRVIRGSWSAGAGLTLETRLRSRWRTLGRFTFGSTRGKAVFQRRLCPNRATRIGEEGMTDSIDAPSKPPQIVPSPYPCS
jgi:hypothetical protein